MKAGSNKTALIPPDAYSGVYHACPVMDTVPDPIYNLNSVFYHLKQTYTWEATMLQMAGRRAAFRAWLFLLVAIPLLSAGGRPLLNTLRPLLPVEWLALLLFLASLLALSACAIWMRRQSGGYRTALLLAGWMIPLFLLLPFTLPVVEERIHFLLFGAFGFFSMLLFPLSVAVMVALLGAGLDELWQWVLPDRVGDWRDVGINAIAGIGGIAAAWLGSKR